MNEVYIALGANMSNPKETFIKALDRLAGMGLDILEVSGLWQSPAWPPGLGHPDYLNAVAKLGYDGTPAELMRVLNDTEAYFGRARTVKNAPRTLDLDIIDFKGIISDDPRVTLPHPRMLSRGFVLFPLVQVAPHWQDPVNGGSIDDHIAVLPLPDVAPMEYRGRFYNGARQ